MLVPSPATTDFLDLGGYAGNYWLMLMTRFVFYLYTQNITCQCCVHDVTLLFWYKEEGGNTDTSLYVLHSEF